MFVLTSPSFAPDGAIPVEFTCEGENVSPVLVWSGVPPRAASLALVIDDPDAPDPAAPRVVWVHWVVYDLPPTAGGLARDAVRAGLPAGAREGKNDWGRVGYGGPCPPVGQHRYFHKLYALDISLGDLGPLTKSELERAIAGHVLATAKLLGVYQKQKRGN